MMTAEKKKRTALVLLAIILWYAIVYVLSVIAVDREFFVWEVIGLCVTGGMLGIAHLRNRRRTTRPTAPPNPTGPPATGC